MTDAVVRSVVLVADHPWPAVSGSRVRAAGIVTALRELGPVDVLALDAAGSSAAWEAANREIATRRRRGSTRLLDVARSVMDGYPVTLERAVRAGSARAFTDVLGQLRPDVVILCRPFVGPFVDAALGAGAMVVIDADESLVRANRSIARSRAPLRRRLRAVLDLWSADRVERAQYRRVGQLWVSSDVERTWFEQRIPVLDSRVIPNLAPCGDLPQDPVAPAGGSGVTVLPIEATAFVGYYPYPPNEEAALELMRTIAPAVRRRGGPSTVLVAGRDPTPPMRRIAADDPHVRLLGEVPDSSAVLREAGVLIVPIRSGAGARVKILEAMRAGVPVVSTPKGIEGLDLETGRHVLVADTPDEFADAVLRLRDDPEARARVVTDARAWVDERHSQAAVSAAVSAALREALAAGIGPRGG